MNRILVIRGGAIGDFVLTLPAIKLLRDGFPNAHLEILGSKHIAVLAEKRFYADAVRSIETASFAKFFASGSELPAELLGYFGAFDLILSYLYDPDKIFETNVEKSGRGTFLAGSSKVDDSEHAAFQLARPLAALGLSLTDPAAHLFPSEEDRNAVRALFDKGGKMIALHPGSGSESKNWPVENWIELGNALLAKGRELMIVVGEADTARSTRLKTEWKGQPVRFAENLPLPQIAALLEQSVFLGHDSGISHLAAAAGARCVLLFGPTEPSIWAPANEKVTVLRAPEGKMVQLEVETVAAALWAAFGSEVCSRTSHSEGATEEDTPDAGTVTS
ncbi:MAG TPA: glycosyltransferase family 9 protein [Chthoniobacterales bacterium]|nr:glycosyltransferase family 9 protein [Chthoniobacterales bacterium]